MRIAVLDLGTNTFHLIVSEVRNKKSAILFKSKIVVKLGEGGIHKKFIASVPFERGLAALEHYAEVIEKYKPAKVFAFATSAIRSARNGKQFIKAAKARSGISIKMISGEKEAEMIYYGVRLCVKMDKAPCLIMDIGGGSTEFIIANANKILWKGSFDIGASRLLEKFRPDDPITQAQVLKLEKYLGKILKPLDLAVKKHPVRKLVGSSGSFDTLAEMIGWKYYGRNVLKNVNAYDFELDDFFRLNSILLRSTTYGRRRMKGLIKMRVDMIVLAGICTNLIIKRYNLEAMTVSKFALKEGALWKVSSGKQS